MNQPEIKDAATVILVRDAERDPKILMGQRGANAAFMPNKFVFPGGAVDAADASVTLANPISAPCNTRLTLKSGPVKPSAIIAAAIRELWEESGLILGRKGNWSDQPSECWTDYAQTGHLPSPEGLFFVSRAITPIGRTRRFDARFLLADAQRVSGDLDDFSKASDELSHLQWVRVNEANSFDLPFITSVVLAEIAAALPAIAAPDGVPFFNNTTDESSFERLG